MGKKENEPNWQFEDPPSGTLSGEDFIAYLARNKIKLREEGDNICRFARNHGIKFVEVKRETGQKFGVSLFKKGEYVDIAENLAIQRVKKLFNCKFANAQPHSGAQANGAVYLALLKPGDTIMGMSLNSGGHLTHGSKASVSGKWFNSIAYEIDKETGLINYDDIEKLALESKPKLIIAGGSAYSRIIDFKKFREISDKVEAYLMVDMAHFSGLVAGMGYPNPVEHAHVVTSTTHKVFRSARGGICLLYTSPSPRD